MKRVFPKYLLEVWEEMTRVIWPKKDEVIRLTFLVVLISVIVGGYMGALDFVFTKLLEALIAV